MSSEEDAYRAALRGDDREKALLRAQRDKALRALAKANAMLFSVGAPLGSEEYFALREHLTETLKETGFADLITEAMDEERRK